jgi:hypothetical protein
MNEENCFYCDRIGVKRMNFGYMPIYLCKECYERKKRENEAIDINLISR